MNSDFCVAVHGMVCLEYRGSILSSEELAENICTNPARVRKVMALLRRGGLIHTREGKDGGYCCIEGAGRITLCQIADALGTRFVENGWHSGGTDRECLIASGMAEVMDALYAQMDSLCRDRLREITLEDVERRLRLKTGGDGKPCKSKRKEKD